MKPPSLRLTDRDFDAYAPARAASNAYSRPRLEFKQRALVWARHVVRRLQSEGIPVDVHASDEHPSVWNGHCVDCQWLFFWRSEASRGDLDALLDHERGIVHAVRDPSPCQRHAFLALRLDSTRVSVCAQVHPDAWVDFETLRARLASDERASHVRAALAQLPDQFACAVGSGPESPCVAMTLSTLRQMVEDAARLGQPLWFGWSVVREVAVEHSTLLDDHLADALLALAPMYAQIAWKAEDDPGGIGARLQHIRSRVVAQVAERAAAERMRKDEDERRRKEQTDQSRERTRERVAYAAHRDRLTLANLFGSDPVHTDRVAGAASSAPTTPRPPSVARESGTARSQEAGPQPTRSASVPGRGMRHAPDVPRRPASLAKGDQVRVLSGPFADKVGVVSELDARGARVMLGLLSTRLSLSELAPADEPRERRPLLSSHRKPKSSGRSRR